MYNRNNIIVFHNVIENAVRKFGIFNFYEDEQKRRKLGRKVLYIFTMLNTLGKKKATLRKCLILSLNFLSSFCKYMITR